MRKWSRLFYVQIRMQINIKVNTDKTKRREEMTNRHSQMTQSKPRTYPERLDGLLNVIAELLVDEAIREHDSHNGQCRGADSNNGPAVKPRRAHV